MAGIQRTKEQLKMMGCGKLSYDYLIRLISKRIVNNDVEYNGASKNELLAIIYLSQIASPAGFVEQFDIKEIASVIGCSERDVYVILSGLSQKGYIFTEYYEGQNWSGIKNIQLVGNDFTGKDYSKTRYISTFYTFFDFSKDETVKFLSGLSLYALRMLLVLLTMYDYKYGLKVTYVRLCAMLSIKDMSLIDFYISELSDYFGTDFIRINRPFLKRRTGSSLFISPRNHLLVAERSPSDNQMSYYKRHILRLIHNNGFYFFNEGNSLYIFLNKLFSFIYEFASKNFSLEHIEELLLHSFSLDENKELDMRTILRAKLYVEQNLST